MRALLAMLLVTVAITPDMDTRLSRSSIGSELKGYQERAAQVLRLAPTSRSLLR